MDVGLSRFTDLMIAFPQLIFMIALQALVPSSFPRELFMISVIAVFGWFSMARVVRAQTITLRHRATTDPHQPRRLTASRARRRTAGAGEAPR